MSAVPDVELDLLVTTIDRAVSRANRGDLAGAHDELLTLGSSPAPAFP